MAAGVNIVKIQPILGENKDENAMTGTSFICYIIGDTLYESMVEKTNPNDV